MAARWRMLGVDLGRGINSRVDDKIRVEPKTVDNLRISKFGAYNKRAGYDVASLGEYHAMGMAAHGEQALVFASQDSGTPNANPGLLLARNSSVAVGGTFPYQVVQGGSLLPWVTSTKQIPVAFTQAQDSYERFANLQVAYQDGTMAVSWMVKQIGGIGDAELYIQTFDYASLSPTSLPTLVSSTTDYTEGTSLFAGGGKFHLIYRDTSSGGSHQGVWWTSTLANTALKATLVLGGNYLVSGPVGTADVAVMDNTHFFTVTIRTATNEYAIAKRLFTDGSTVASVNVTGIATLYTLLSASYDGTLLQVASVDNNAGTYIVRTQGFNPTTLAQVGVTLTIYSSATSAVREISQSKNDVAFGLANGRTLRRVSGTSETLAWASNLGTRPLVATDPQRPDQPRTYYCLEHVEPNRTQSALVAMRANNTIDIKWCDGVTLGGQAAANRWNPPTWFSPSSGVYATAIRTLGGVNTTAFSLVTIDTNQETKPHSWAEYDGTTYFGGPVVKAYDGNSVSEYGFTFFPEVASTTPGGGSGALNGTYSWRFTWKWRDANGRIHESAPSAAVTASVATPAYVDFTIRSLPFTDKSAIWLGVYRTIASGQVYYEETFYNAGALTAPIFNDPTANTATFRSQVADSTLESQAQLYTGGTTSPGEVENIAPPAARYVTLSNNRLWLAGVDNEETTAWFSKQLTQGIPPGFNDSFVINTAASSAVRSAQELTGIAALDSNTVMFSQETCSVVTGDGPDNTGQGSYGLPQPITSDVGCSDGRCIARIPDGLIYPTSKGIGSLSRAVDGVLSIGTPVSEYDPATIVAVAVSSAENQVRFYTRSGTTLIFDHLANQWVTASTQAASGAANVAGVIHWSSYQDNDVYSENQSVFTQGGSSYPFTLDTNWIHVAGPNGFQFVRRMFVLGTYKAPHTLTLSVAYDYNDTFVQVASWDTATAVADAAQLYELSCYLGRRCTSIRMRLQDGSQSGTQESAWLSHISLEVAAGSMGAKLLAAKKR